jgi:antitoxin component of RelBE/YafQ-DinJ toxin-antitoxin module
METTKRTRNQLLVIRLNDDERGELNAVAADDRLTASDVVRMLVRREYVRRFGDKKPKARRT